MFERAKLNEVENYFQNYANRVTKGIYFCRLTTYNENIKAFLIRYLEDTKKCGVYIKGKIKNPDENQLAFLEEMTGNDFHLDKNFLNKILIGFLPRLDEYQRACVVESLWNTLMDMSKDGKNENMLKNAYIKFMCWFYYKFERILNQLGKDVLPKILYEGSISNYELKILCILANAGCDILLVETKGDSDYLKLDPVSKFSEILQVSNGQAFPPDFSVTKIMTSVPPIRQSPQRGIVSPPLPSRKEEVTIRLTPANGIMSTNTWLTGQIFEDSLKERAVRGEQKNFYYNMFVKIRGVWDKGSYLNELLRWKLKLEGNKLKVVITEKMIGMPDGMEVQKINRSNDTNRQKMMLGLLGNISFPKNRELECLARKAFVELLEEDKEIPIQKLNNRAVTLLCWINRYLPELFSEWKIEGFPVFIHYGVCESLNESYLFRFLARMPVDVFLICPDLSLPCLLQDKILFEKVYEESLPLSPFPKQIDSVKFGTVAFHAEQDLNSLLYQDSGVYRNQQFKKAIPVKLQTTYEEIGILWNQEAKYRPNFEILDDRVMVPVILSKVSGVPQGDVNKYWNDFSKLLGEDTFCISSLPFIKPDDENKVKQYAVSFIKDGKLQVEKIKSSPSYQYAFIREDMQDYIFDKLQQLLDTKIITGTFTQGMEYTIIANALNLNMQILRMIQKYDFTKVVPKVVIVNTGESMNSVEDSILVAYLSVLGFDVAVFSPTGYQSVERYFSKDIMVEHQVGEYLYDLTIPRSHGLLKSNQKESFTSKLFRRGR